MPIPTLAAKGDQTAIDGVWRLEVDPQVLLDEGQSQMDASNNGGTWTWTFKNGVADYQEPRGRECTITYVLNGRKFLGIGYDLGCDNVLPLVVERSGTRCGDSMPRSPDGDPRRERRGSHAARPSWLHRGVLPQPAGAGGGRPLNGRRSPWPSLPPCCSPGRRRRSSGCGGSRSARSSSG